MYKNSGEISINESGYELKVHGDLFYPVGCYQGDITKNFVIWHCHDELEVIIVKKGAIKISAGQNEAVLSEGEGCFINSNVFHAIYRTELENSLLRSFVFHTNLIGDKNSVYFRKYVKPIIENKNQQFVIFNDENIISTIHRAWIAEAEETPGFEFEVREALSKIIYLLSTDNDEKISTLTNKELRDIERTKLMMNYMESNFASNLNLDQIAKVTLLSKDECIRCFKRSTGKSPMQFLKQYRLFRAAELIRSTRLNISSIAEQCGFIDMSYFARSFKQIFNESPTEYRNKY